MVILPLFIAIFLFTKVHAESFKEVIRVGTAMPIDTLTLQSEVDPQGPFYPGDTFSATYRIYYKGSTVLTVENLPLLNLNQFEKVSGKEIRETVQHGMNVQEISQSYRVKRVGTYTVAKSVIEGHVYTENAYGEIEINPLVLRSETEGFSLVVQDFPEETKPLSFNGAIGLFTWTVEMQTPFSVHAGDEIALKISANGRGVFSSLNLPNLFCQPGFLGFFKGDDLPPNIVRTDIGVEFIVKLRPMIPGISELPSIEFSSFDPKKKGYVVFRSSPIPIEVLPLESVVKKAPLNETSPWRENFNRKVETDIVDIKKLRGDLKACFMCTWQMLYIFPLGVFGVYLILIFRKFSSKANLSKKSNKSRFKQEG